MDGASTSYSNRIRRRPDADSILYNTSHPRLTIIFCAESQWEGEVRVFYMEALIGSSPREYFLSAHLPFSKARACMRNSFSHQIWGRVLPVFVQRGLETPTVPCKCEIKPKNRTSVWIVPMLSRREDPETAYTDSCTSCFPAKADGALFFPLRRVLGLLEHGRNSGHGRSREE